MREEEAKLLAEKKADILLEIRELTKTFSRGSLELPVLRGISATVRTGQMISIVGASGSGKSTLLHILGTLDRPTSGAVIFDGEDLAALDSERLSVLRNSCVGFVFQFHHLLADFTALENAMIPSLIARRSRRKAMAEAEEILSLLGLEGRLGHYPGQLSGGELQRVSLARALANEPRLLLADEPTGNLDSDTSREIQELLFRINEDMKTTIIIATHDAELASRTPRRLRLFEGQLFEKRSDLLGGGDDLMSV